MSTKSWYIVMVAAAWGMYLWSNASPALLLACLLLLILPVSLLQNRLVAPKLHVSVEIRGQQEKEEKKENENGELVADVSVENTGIFPAFRVCVVVEIQNCLTGSAYRIPCEFGVAGRSRARQEIRLESLYCGRIEGEIQQAVVCDFLGFSSRTVSGKSRGGWYSYPSEQAQDFFAPEQMQKDELQREERYTHTKGNDITEILNLREYQKGDNIKTIHWKLSKKLGYKVVKELDMPASQDVILLLALSSDNAEQERLRHLVAGAMINVSRLLLQEQIFYDAVLIRDKGASHGVYTIQEQKTLDWYEQLLLDGNMEWKQDYVEQYITYHHVLSKYARVILVTDSALEGWYQEHAQVIQICVS
jgi:hypothetical protein